MFYVLTFSIIGVAVEFGKFNARNTFYLLNFGWGKSCFAFLQAFLLIGAGRTDPPWNDVLTCVILILLAIFYGVISILYRSKEEEAVLQEIEKIKDEENK